MTRFLARREVFASVGSTNDIVRTWLAAGTAEVCLAVADEQTAGRGRAGRRWVAPRGAALLLSVGFRPAWLDPDRVWRLAAVVSLAMAEAAEAVAGLPAGAIRLKWPNDLVAAGDGRGDVRKLAGVLGETDGLGTADPRAVVGIGIDTDWAPADFPPDLAATMTSLRAVGGRPVDDDALLAAFLERLEAAVVDLRRDRFAAAAWADRQLTTGRLIRLETPAGPEDVRAVGVDPSSGALIVDGGGIGDGARGRRSMLVGEVIRLRLADPIAERV
jgi:BirA family biotin operon repressor/biotin-[acetyl-CoA-carboxylase] ligase